MIPISTAIPQAMRRAHASMNKANEATTQPALQTRADPPLSLAKKPKVALLREEEYAPSQLNLVTPGGGGVHFPILTTRLCLRLSLEPLYTA